MKNQTLYDESPEAGNLRRAQEFASKEGRCSLNIQVSTEFRELLRETAKGMEVSIKTAFILLAAQGLESFRDNPPTRVQVRNASSRVDGVNLEFHPIGSLFESGVAPEFSFKEGE